jgi:hypothetical protein
VDVMQLVPEGDPLEQVYEAVAAYDDEDEPPHWVPERDPPLGQEYATAAATVLVVYPPQ